MRDGHVSLLVIHFDGLAVSSVCCAGRSVSGVRYGNAAIGKTGENISGKNFTHQAQVFVGVEESVLIDNYAAALLASVLQGIQAVITHPCHIRRLLCHYSKNTAFFVDLHDFAPH